MVKISTGNTSILLENLEDEPLDIDIDVITGMLYWITASGQLQTYSAMQIQTISEFRGYNIPTSFAVFEVYGYVAFLGHHSVVRIDLLKPQSR